MKRIKDIIYYLSVILVAIAITRFARFGHVVGESMEPSIHDGDVTITNTFAYKFSKPKRGDVVLIYSGIEGEEILLKRVIGEPGDNISFKNGNVYINGNRIDEPYIMEGAETLSEDGLDNVTLGEDEVFCMGDNREESFDSRWLGPVNIHDLDGKVNFRINTHIDAEAL